jgi:hypothetical protein
VKRPDRLEARVAGVRRRLRLQVALVAACSGSAAALAVLVVAWLAGEATLFVRPSPLPLLLVGAGVLGALAAALRAAQRIRRIDERAVAASAEEGLGVAHGWLRGALELSRKLPDGASEALARRERELAEARVLKADARTLGGPLAALIGRGARRAAVLAAASVLAVVALAFAAPERSTRAWGALAHPLDHLTPPPLPALVVSPGDAGVPRGEDLAVEVRAEGRSEVTLRWRAQGDIERERTFAVEDGRARGRLERVDAQLFYWVTARDGAVSRRYRVTPLDPLLLTELRVELHYPAYLRRPAEQLEGELAALEVPYGTEIRLAGRGTRDWTRIALREEGSSELIALRPRGSRFEGRWSPERTGVFHWVLEADGGGALVPPPPLEVRVLGDERPSVELVFPGRDTLLGPDMRQPLVADARDDHGLTAAALLSWRVGAYGERDEPVTTAIPLAGEPDRIVLRAVLDAEARRLLPGDALHYQVRVTDNSPRRQTAVSGTYVLRLPSMAELRREALSAGGSLVDDAERVTRTAREMERASRELARRGAPSARPQGNPEPRNRAGGEPRDLEFQRAEDARQLLEQQEALAQHVEELRQGMQEMERALEAAGLRDAEVQRRMEELRSLLEQALTPEMRQKMEELRRSLEELDGEQMQQALRDMAEQQEEFRERLERMLELMRRAAAEQQMAALAEEAKELATQQEALAEAMRDEAQRNQGERTQAAPGEQARQSQQAQQAQQTQQAQAQAAAAETQPLQAGGAENGDRAAQQAALAERADSLTSAMQQLAQQLARTGEPEAAAQTEEAAEQSGEAQQAMQQAAQQANAGSSQQAAQSGEQGAERMAQAAQSLERTREQMTESWRREAREAMQQATEEALSLSQRQNALAQQMANQQQAGQQSDQQNASSAQMRGEQAALQQGLEQMGRNLSEAGQRSALVSREVGSSLSRALSNMKDALDAMQTNRDGGPRLPVAEATRAAEALNQLALSLLENQDRMQGSQAGTGFQQLMEELADLAKQQGGVNSRTNSLLPLDLGTHALAEQMQQLGRQQAEIGRRLGGLNRGGAEESDGRLSDMAEEAEQLARELAGGRMNPELLQRQQELFHRLLDAGRTLERDEYSEERVASRPTLPTDPRRERMDLRELEGARRYPLPTDEELRRLPPSYRRLILEYFDRLNSAAPEGDGR